MLASWPAFVHNITPYVAPRLWLFGLSRRRRLPTQRRAGSDTGESANPTPPSLEAHTYCSSTHSCLFLKHENQALYQDAFTQTPLALVNIAQIPGQPERTESIAVFEVACIAAPVHAHECTIHISLVICTYAHMNACILAVQRPLIRSGFR